MTRHRLFDPEGMLPGTGFSYGSVAAEGRLLHIAGLTGHHPDSSLDESIVEQFAVACEGVARVIGEAGGQPGDLVSMIIYTSAIEEYRDHLEPIGVAYRGVFGRHYPPMALLGVAELFDPKAKVELVATAVVPNQPG